MERAKRGRGEKSNKKGERGTEKKGRWDQKGLIQGLGIRE